MGEKSLAATERQELCDLMDRLGPDAGTLCAGWTTRDLAAHARRARRLWARLRQAARLFYRNSPVNVVLRTPDGLQRTIGGAPRSVTLIGSPDELVLHAFGRGQAVLDIAGDPADIAALRDSHRRV